uniref:histone acetyltransferase n=1 Tax=Pogona vitticeps TaxID=103695 RepID=A0A6J0SF86_9SAUR
MAGAAAAAAGGSAATGWGAPRAPGQGLLLGGGAPSWPPAGLLGPGRLPPSLAGGFRRGSGRPSCPQEPALAHLEELVRKLRVTEERERDPPRQAGSAPLRSGLVPAELGVQKPQDGVGRFSCAGPKIQATMDDSSLGEQQTRPSWTFMTLRPRFWDQYLVHAGQCRRDSCLQPSCQDTKRLVQHLQACRCNNLEHCQLCNQLITICYVHAQHCKENHCPAPFCLAIKPQLLKMPMWLLPAKVKHGKMVAMSTARAQRVSRSVGAANAAWQTGMNAQRPGCVNGPIMSNMQPEPRPFAAPFPQMEHGLRLPSTQPPPCTIPWSVMSFLRRTMKSFRFPEEKAGSLSPR